MTSSEVRVGFIARRLPGLNEAREEVELLLDQRAALEATLPSPGEVKRAEKEATKLAGRGFDESEQCRRSWSAFMAALEGAEAAARKVATSRSETQETVREVSRLEERFGLDLELPKIPKPTTAESKIAGLIGLLLRRAGYSMEIDRQIDNELAAARKQAEREAA